MRRTISDEVWEQAKIAFASGSIGLRELARKMNIPPGTITARASREGWSKKIEEAKQAAGCEQSLAVKPTVLQSVAVNMQERANRHVECIAGVTDKVLPHLEKMKPDKILDGIDEIEKYDRMARRNYGLGDGQQRGGSLSLRILTGQAAVELIT